MPLIQDEKAVYYKQTGYNEFNQAFKPFFKMVAGDPSLRTYNPQSLAQQAVQYTCLRAYGDNTKPTYSTGFPPAACAGGIRAEVTFPSCWNGVDLDSADHKSHMSYVASGQACSGVNVPTVLVEAIFRSQDFTDWSQALNPSQPFVLSTGDTTGYSFHGDFMSVSYKFVSICVC